MAQRLGRHRSTVESWVPCVNARGLEGLQPAVRGRPRPRLGAEEVAELQRMAAQPPRRVGLKTGTWTGKGVVAFITRRFGKTISAATARRSLHRLGCRRKRPRKRLERANPEAQRTFAQALQVCERDRAPGGVTVSRDQGQMWQDALPRFGWF